MNFSQAVASGFKNYARFALDKGRASRSEFWYWSLFATLVSFVGLAVDLIAFPEYAISPVATALDAALLLPNVGVSIRRLHDIDRGGWWLLIAFTVIGLILLLVWDCRKGTDGPNRFGPDPLAPAPAT
jgi:uncharacterized membrane protein YhaH (DUF805 family)